MCEWMRTEKLGGKVICSHGDIWENDTKADQGGSEGVGRVHGNRWTADQELEDLRFCTLSRHLRLVRGVGGAHGTINNPAEASHRTLALRPEPERQKNDGLCRSFRLKPMLCHRQHMSGRGQKQKWLWAGLQRGRGGLLDYWTWHYFSFISTCRPLLFLFPLLLFLLFSLRSPVDQMLRN